MNSKEIRQKIEEEKYIHINVMFEVVGKPKEHVETAIKNYVGTLKTDEDIVIIKEDVEEAAQQQDDVWSTIAEIEMLVKNLNKLTWLCLNFMPASVEIMSPETLIFKARDLTNWLNDMLAKNHEVSFMSQHIGQQNKVMLKSINALVRNFILMCVDSKINDPNTISKKTGIGKKDLEPVFEAMIKEKILKKEKNMYVRP